MLLTHQQPCFKAYSVNRGVFENARVCFHRRVYTDTDQAKVLAEGHWNARQECHRSTMSQTDAEVTARWYIEDNEGKWKHEEGIMVCPLTGRFSKM